PAVVMGDEEELKTAITNLLDNAIKYSEKPVHVEVQVETENSEATPSVAVRIRDQGVGIPRSELKQIFKRFYRIPGAVGRRVKGTGLGLYIVRSVIERHGGKVQVESEGLGRGSTFTVRLPGALESAHDHP